MEYCNVGSAKSPMFSYHLLDSAIFSYHQQYLQYISCIWKIMRYFRTNSYIRPWVYILVMGRDRTKGVIGVRHPKRRTIVIWQGKRVVQITSAGQLTEPKIFAGKPLTPLV